MREREPDRADNKEMETTEKLGLKKPGESDYYNVADQNENMDRLEAAIEERLEKTSLATAAANGVMAAADKAKLDGIEAGANNYVHPGSGTNPHGTTKADVGLGNADNTADAQKIVRGMKVHLGLGATGLVEANTNMNSVLEAIRTKMGYGHMIAWLHRNTDAVYLTDAPSSYGIVAVFYGANAPSWIRALFIEGNNIYSYDPNNGAWNRTDAGNANTAYVVKALYTNIAVGLSNDGGIFCSHSLNDQNVNAGGVDNTTYLGAGDYRWKAVFAASGTIQTSDARYKKDVERIDAKQAAAFLMALNPSWYKYIDGDSGRRHAGLIAQEVKEAMTEAGIEDCGAYIREPLRGGAGQAAEEENVMYALRYDEFIAPMVAVMQEQERRIAALEERIAAMEDGQAAMKGGGETE